MPCPRPLFTLLPSTSRPRTHPQVVWTALNATPFDQWALRMWAHAVIQSQASPDLLTPLAAPLPLGSPLTTPRAALQAVADAASPARRPLDPRAADLYWELHARASAVVAAGYALTLHTNSTALAGDAGAGAAGPAAAGAAPGLPVQMMHAQLQSTLAEIDAQVSDVATRPRRRLLAVLSSLLPPPVC